MNGAGNDFILLDNRNGEIRLGTQEISALCDRHRGIGGDGLLMCEEPSSTSNGGNKAMARMRYYNADGNEVEMCGNGARCFTRFVARLLKKRDGKIIFETMAGILEGELLENEVKISMSIPHSICLHHPIGEYGEVHSINTGVPHVVLFVDDLEHAPVIKVGRALRHHSQFAPAGTNVNFVKVLEPNHLAVRTYERGVEDETLACGTGVVASALIHHLLSKARSPMKVIVHGGEILEVDFTLETIINSFPQFQEVALKGPAVFVFEGSTILNTP
ncbi:MAG: diaminopimelate epimerase [Verrucomicrobia bacterium]|nr:MAG: diaminopimelate epimerase [Verrucomicrobiota bacterium]